MTRRRYRMDVCPICKTRTFDLGRHDTVFHDRQVGAYHVMAVPAEPIRAQGRLVPAGAYVKGLLMPWKGEK